MRHVGTSMSADDIFLSLLKDQIISIDTSAGRFKCQYPKQSGSDSRRRLMSCICDRAKLQIQEDAMRRIIGVIVLVIAGGIMFAQEPPAYMLAKLTITDQDTYGKYRAGFGGIFQQYGGEILAASGEPTVLEGEWEATITVLIRFDSRNEALEWYNSDGYQELVRIRQAASTGEFILMDGR